MAYIPTPIAPAKRALISRAVSDGRRVGLSIAFVEGGAKRLNQMGASWFAPRRMWNFRVQQDSHSLASLIQDSFSDAREFDIESISEQVEVAINHPEIDFFTSLLDVQIFRIDSGGHAVSFAYDPFAVDAMRSLGGRFHKFAAAWEVKRPVEQILHALQSLAGIAQDYVFLHERPVVFEDLIAAPKAEVPISVPASVTDFPSADQGDSTEDVGAAFMSTMVQSMSRLPVDEVQLASAAKSFGLYDYQIAGVRHLLARSSALLADDMGLGKTRQAVVASGLASGNGRILVVCPASLRINWEREIHAVFPDNVIGMVGEDRIATLYGCKWIISNYERLGSLVREPKLSFSVMTVDEAHYLKEHEAGRTRNAFLMAERIERRFLLTGTPLLSREIEIHTLLRLSGHPLGILPLADFRKQYAGGQTQRAALAGQLKEWMLRRRKDVLKGLGNKTRQVRYVTPAEGLGRYQAVLHDMSLTVMPKIVKLRQTLESMKIDFLVESIQCLAPDDKAIVFCEYMSSVNALKEAFEAAGIGCVSLVGSDAGPKRQKAVDAFQQNPAVRVFVGTTSAAGVGITLTAANYVMFCSLPWTPALMRQAEDRAYRNGQKRDVTVIVPLISGTIDEQIHALLDSKSALEHEVVEVVRAHLDLH